MRAKTTVFFLFLIVLSALLLVSTVSAWMTHELALNLFVEDMSEANVEEATALFAEDAVVINGLTSTSYEGSDEIGPLLESWANDGRRYEVVAESNDGNTSNLTIDVSDQGVVWAQMRLTAEMNDGLIQNLTVQDIRLTYGLIN